MGRRVRRSILYLSNIITKRIDYANRERSRITSDDYKILCLILKPGDVILTNTKWRLTNLLIPGHFNHAVMYVGNGYIVESTVPYVRDRDLLDLLLSIDDFAVVKPRITNTELSFAVAEMESLKGKPYDMGFTMDDDAFYCSEAIYHSIMAATDGKFMFTKRRILGADTIVPNDMFLARQFFELKMDSRA